MIESPQQRIGRLNRQNGKRKQASVRRRLETIYDVTCDWEQNKRDEETWLHLPISVEVKAGKQCRQVLDKYRLAAEQSDGHGPFVATLSDDWGKTLAIISLEDVEQLTKIDSTERRDVAQILTGNQCKPVFTLYKKAYAQHTKALPNDHRPFAYIACPNGTRHSYLVCVLQHLESILDGKNK